MKEQEFSSEAASQSSEEPESKSHQLHSSAWIDYKESVRQFVDAKMASDPGYFAKDSAQKHYELCQACPLNQWRYIMPLLFLPLRIHLIRSPWLGCSSEGLHKAAIQTIVQEINIFWAQASIGFDLVSVEEHECQLPRKIQEDLKFFVKHTLRRGNNGKMMHKAERKRQFVNVLLSSFEKDGENANQHSCYYDIWFMDMVGHESQGICIDRKKRTIIMGERSTKGYETPTKRPHQCLAKTAAHELGHALSLGHPRGQTFDDGQDQILTKDMENLMSGGIDRKGGGGAFLEDWQISAARQSAEMVLRKNRKSRKRTNQ